MSMGEDYIKLINTLWNFDEYTNTWNPQGHWSLAYLIDRLYGTEGYEETLNRWLHLAETKNFYDFAWDVMCCTVEVTQKDEIVSEAKRNYCRKTKEEYWLNYQKKELYVFGIVSKTYVPDWFWGVFQGYMTLKIEKCKQAVIAYGIKECGLAYEDAVKQCDQLYKFLRLFIEFNFYLKENRYTQICPCVFAGYTAEMVHNALGLNALDSYMYLIAISKSSKEELPQLLAKLNKS